MNTFDNQRGTTFEPKDIREIAEAIGESANGDIIAIVVHEPNRHAISKALIWAHAAKCSLQDYGKDVEVRIGQWTIQQAREFLAKTDKNRE